MFRVFNIALASLFLALTFSGCSDTDPKPEDTVVGQPKRMINGPDLAGEYSGLNGPNGAGSAWNGGELGDIPSDRDINGGFDPANGFGQPMDSVYFGFDQSSIPAAERPKVDAAATYLRNNPGAKLIAEGHTDAIGTSEYNLALSDRRANSVKTYLEQLGIPGDRVEILGMGEQMADASAQKGSDAAARDRRVDLIPQ